MGIRFRCPHCNRPLNIKASQAGQLGICPKCHEKLQVPMDSELDLDGNELSGSVSMSAFEGIELNPPIPAQAWSSLDSDSDAAREEQEDFLCGRPGSAVHQIVGDPIFEAPNRIWHIRDAKRVESGPIKGKRLRKMIDNGSLKANDFVCREDWQDWQLASEAFPELGVASSQVPIASQSVFTDSSYEISGEVTAKARKAKQKRQLVAIQMAGVVGGLLIVAALCYLLVKVI